MQSNVDCIMDDLNDFPDSWVELYNGGSEAVNLGDYRLGLSQNADEAWAFPQQTLQPQGYVLVYCDKVGCNTETCIHTDFRLDSGKNDYITLFKNNSIADQIVKLKKQPAPNIAYGRRTSGSNDWGYMAVPTPLSPNCDSLCADVLSTPVFSMPGGIWNMGEEVQLSISVPSDAPVGTVVRFTTDGTEPTAESPVFSDPLSLTENTVVRATLFCDDYLSPRSTVHSYLFFPNSRPLTLPVISIVTPPSYLYDEKIGIYVNGEYQSDKKNYEFNWYRPANFEFFETMRKQGELNQLCEIRIGGGASRVWTRKTLVVKAHKRFGEKRLKYEFFPDQRPGITDFKSLLLRNAGNDFNGLYLRDAFIQRLMSSHVDLDWQAWRPAIVYINGEYTGILNIRERSNEDNIYSNYDGLEDIDMFEGLNTLKEGTGENYDNFKAFYAEKNHTMEEYERWMDCKEFANLMIANIYFDNADFSGGNMVLWRPRAEDGRWRWIAKDMDYTLGIYNIGPDYNTFAWIYDNAYDNTRAWANRPQLTLLFRNLMDDDDFRRIFVERFAVYMGDFLNVRGVSAVMDMMCEQIETEFPYHRAAIGKESNLESERKKIYDWLSLRSDYMYEYMSEMYNLGKPHTLTVNVIGDASESARVLFNGIPLSQCTFDGKFFLGQEVRLQMETEDDVVWKVSVNSDEGAEESNSVEGNVCSFIMPDCKSVHVTAAVTRVTTGINVVSLPDIESYPNGSWYTLDGRRLRSKPTMRGLYIRDGKKFQIR